MTDFNDWIKPDKRKPKDGWATGYYANKCLSCKREFTGDKRATQCAPCAYEDKNKG